MDPQEACRAYCRYCNHHLNKPFNAYLAQCPQCRDLSRISIYPCTCPLSIPEDMDARLYPLDELSDVRTDIESSALSRQRKRILLLVTLVPEGEYTTVAAIKECMNDHFQRTGRDHVIGALEKNVWIGVPVHRVMDSGYGSCLGGGGQSVAVGDEMDSRMLLAEEGVRFDKNGRALGPAFRFF